MQEDVLGLDVAVDHVLAVRIVERTRHLARDANRLGDRQLAFALESRAECLPRHERHHIVQQAVGVAAVEERQDVRMLQPRGRTDLAQEPLATERRAEVGMQHLDGDIAIVLEIMGEIHGGHAARAEFAFDAVVAGERRLQPFKCTHNDV